MSTNAHESSAKPTRKQQYKKYFPIAHRKDFIAKTIAHTQERPNRNHAETDGNHAETDGNHAETHGNHTEIDGNHAETNGNHAKTKQRKRSNAS